MQSNRAIEGKIVELKPDFFITQSDRIYCAASLNALADIIVHIISQTYGRAAAQNVERNFSHEIVHCSRYLAEKNPVPVKKIEYILRDLCIYKRCRASLYRLNLYLLTLNI